MTRVNFNFRRVILDITKSRSDILFRRPGPDKIYLKLPLKLCLALACHVMKKSLDGADTRNFSTGSYTILKGLSSSGKAPTRVVGMNLSDT